MNANLVIHVLERSLYLDMQRILIPHTEFDFSFPLSGRDQVQKNVDSGELSLF